MTIKEIDIELKRSELAESIQLPIKIWRAYLLELKKMKQENDVEWLKEKRE